MAISSFQPTIWAKELQRGLEKNLVSEFAVNHNYEGDAANAVSVKINTVGDYTVADYAAGTPLSYQTPDLSAQTLNLDKKKVIPITFDDVELAQTADGGRVMVSSMEKAGYNLAAEQDATVIAAIVAAVEAGNTIGSDASPADASDSAKALKIISDLVTKADEANMPVDGRVFLCTPAFYNMLISDPKISMALSMSKSAKTGDLGTGYQGEILGVQVYKSNNIPKTTTNSREQAVLTHPSFNTVANQQNRVKMGNMESQVGQWVQAINVYGVKAVVTKSALAIVSFQ